jgi:hypothetical protein
MLRCSCRSIKRFRHFATLDGHLLLKTEQNPTDVRVVEAASNESCLHQLFWIVDPVHP